MRRRYQHRILGEKENKKHVWRNCYHCLKCTDFLICAAEIDYEAVGITLIDYLQSRQELCQLTVADNVYLKKHNWRTWRRSGEKNDWDANHCFVYKIARAGISFAK